MSPPLRYHSPAASGDAADPRARAGGVKVLLPGAGPALHVLDDVATFKVDAAEAHGAFSVVELETPAGGGTPPHAHRAADLVLYVLAGRYALSDDRGTLEIGAGACVLVPRGVRFAYENVGVGRGRLLIVSSPPTSRDGVFAELAARLGDEAGSPELLGALAAIAAHHGIALPQTPGS